MPLASLDTQLTQMLDAADALFSELVRHDGDFAAVKHVTPRVALLPLTQRFRAEAVPDDDGALLGLSLLTVWDVARWRREDPGALGAAWHDDTSSPRTLNLYNARRWTLPLDLKAALGRGDFERMPRARELVIFGFTAPVRFAQATKRYWAALQVADLDSLTDLRDRRIDQL